MFFLEWQESEGDAQGNAIAFNPIRGVGRIVQTNTAEGIIATQVDVEQKAMEEDVVSANFDGEAKMLFFLVFIVQHAVEDSEATVVT